MKLSAHGRLLVALIPLLCFQYSPAADSPPLITAVSVATNSQQKISWTPYPAAQEFKIFSSSNLFAPFWEDHSGLIAGYDWTAPVSGRLGFHRVQVTPLSSNAVLAATILNRLSY